MHTLGGLLWAGWPGFCCQKHLRGFCGPGPTFVAAPDRQCCDTHKPHNYLNKSHSIGIQCIPSTPDIPTTPCRHCGSPDEFQASGCCIPDPSRIPSCCHCLHAPLGRCFSPCSCIFGSRPALRHERTPRFLCHWHRSLLRYRHRWPAWPRLDVRRVALPARPRWAINPAATRARATPSM